MFSGISCALVASGEAAAAKELDALEEEDPFAEAEEYMSPMEVLDAQLQAQADRRRLVRNRWQLYWMLHQNPILQVHRYHALEVMFQRHRDLTPLLHFRAQRGFPLCARRGRVRFPIERSRCKDRPYSDSAQARRRAAAWVVADAWQRGL